MKLVARIRRAVRRAANLAGYDIVAYAPVPPSFYPMSPTCQIPNLGFICELVFGGRRSGSFVEAGAFDGYSYSNTWGLVERGWHGVLIEPVPAFAEACRERYRGNDRIRVINAAAGRGSGEITIHVSGPYSTGNAASFTEDSRVGRRLGRPSVVTAKVRTLDELLATAGVAPEFDLLVVDVEGSEGDVFAGFDLAFWRPTMLIVELTDMIPSVEAHRDEHAALGLKIADAGYRVVFKDTANTIFVKREGAGARPGSEKSTGEG